MSITSLLMLHKVGPVFGSFSNAHGRVHQDAW
jgi:hypothetical protein